MQVRRTHLHHQVEKRVDLCHQPSRTNWTPGEPGPRSSLRSAGVKNPSSLALFFLAEDADAGPRNSVQAGTFDFFLAVHTDAVCSLIHPVDGFLDGAENLCICLLQGQVNMEVAFLAGLVDPVPTFRAGFCGGLSEGGGSKELVSLLFQNIPVPAQFRWLHKFEQPSLAPGPEF